MHADLLIQKGHVVDPLNGLDKIADIAMSNGKIVAVSECIDPTTAKEVIDASGLLAVPGVVDSHVHLVRKDSCGVSYNMLLRRGVTTALDMSGSIDVFVPEMRDHGHGITAGCLHALVIGTDLTTNDTGRDEIAAAIDATLARGAFGIKILGGHYPHTPKATALIIDECAKRGAYVSIHAGSTETGSNIQGMEEAARLADGRPLHIAHVNAYCRGQIESPLLESARLLACLEKHPNLVSESYLSVMNGTNATLDENGRPRSAVTRTWLEKRGYNSDKAGMRQAIQDGWALIYATVGGEMDFLSPEDGHAYWERNGYTANCSFPVNNPVAMLACATARRADGSFTVDAISTDGGAIPRNVIFENGIRLVQMRYMTLSDLVAKSSLYPARMLGLFNKGHLSSGADADVALFDPMTGKARYTIAGGKVRMAAGVCFEGPGVVATSPQGEQAVKRAGVPLLLPELDKSTFMRSHGPQA